MHVAGWMRWHHPVFVHWRVPFARVAPHLPDGVALDRRPGDCYLSLVALGMEGPVPRFAAAIGAERLLRYHQINLRTYVVGERGPGVVLLETWVDRRVAALGARLAGMPYHRVRPLELTVDDGDVTVSGPGLHLDGVVPLERASVPVIAGGLDEFLLERYWVYGQLPGSRAYAVGVQHAAWRYLPIAWRTPPVVEHPLLEGLGDPIASYLGDERDVDLLQVVPLDEGAPHGAFAPAPI